MGNMEMRQGAWTSQTRLRDAQEIERLAKRIRDAASDAGVADDAAKIVRLAQALERDLR